MRGSLGHASQPFKRHLDRFICFCTAYQCAEQTDTHTHRETTLLATSVATDRTLCTARRQYGLKIDFDSWLKFIYQLEM